MESVLQQPADEIVWNQVAPALEEAMNRLNEKERTLLALRFFENRTIAETAALLGIEEWAARKRASRAMGKLQKFFSRSGVHSTAEAITGAISTNAIQPAPALLAKTVTTVALAKGATASTSILTLTKGALKIMAWTKMKTTIMASAVVLLTTTVVITPYVWKYHLSPNAWRNRFDATYRLKDGENIRYIKPPFIPERMTYYRTDQPSQAKAAPRGPDFMTLQQDGGKLGMPGMGFGFKQHLLRRILDDPLGFWSYEFDAPDSVLNINLPGDWTIRKGVGREDLLKALEPIILKATRRKILFEKQSVERDAIVAHGTMAEDFSGGQKVQIYAEKKGGGGMRYGNLQEFLGVVGEQINTYMVIEANTNDAATFGWEYSADSNVAKMGNRREELTERVLKNITDQTGLTFTREKRTVDVWFVTEQK